MKKYWIIFKLYWGQHLEYRGELFTWILVEFTAFASAIFIWSAIYRTNNMVGTYDIKAMLGYYFLIPVIASFTTVFISEGLPKKIKNGEISTDVIRPFNFQMSIFMHNVSVLLIKQMLKLPVYVITLSTLLFVFSLKFDLWLLGLAIVISILSFLLHFFLDLCLSYMAFWMDGIWSLSHIKFVCLLIFGGQLFPLDLVPEKIQWIFNVLPFRFIFYFPLAVALGKVNIEQLWQGLWQLLAWITFFYLLNRRLWEGGLKKYGAYGN